MTEDLASQHQLAKGIRSRMTLRAALVLSTRPVLLLTALTAPSRLAWGETLHIADVLRCDVADLVAGPPSETSRS